MKFMHSVPARRLLVALTVIAIVTPAQPLLATGPSSMAKPKPQAAPVKLKTQDVELQADGTLQGYYINEEQGAGQAGVKVTLHQNSQKPLATTTTGKNGAFQFEGLTGGTYQVVVNDEQVLAYRVWATGTAPPRTSKNVMFKSGEATRAAMWFAGLPPEGQIAVIALITAAIVGGILLLDDDDDKKNQSEEGDNDDG
jgi:hypothetical protein